MNEQADLRQLPANLPRPQDEGEARHLKGMQLPKLFLPSTSGVMVDLSAMPRTTIVYAYPMTGVPGVPLPADWDSIPGSRGCTVECLAFKDHRAEIEELGADVYGLSTQDTAYQKELADRLHLPFSVLSDARLELTNALMLPTMSVEGKTLLKRVTLVLEKREISHVFYPVFPPNEAASTVLEWLRTR